jgi:hypothetical protein
MARQIDQNVDTVIHDLSLQLRVARLANVEVSSSRASNSLRLVIIRCRVCIALHLEAIGIVAANQVLAKEPDGMFAKIGREIADSQTWFGSW